MAEVVTQPTAAAERDNGSEQLAHRARRSILSMTHTGRAAHVGSSLSVVDILAVLYSGVASVSPRRVDDRARDYVFVSKGHAAAATYAVLGHAGFFPVEWLDDYCRDGARLGGHVTSHGIPGVELSTGSLGHALPFAAGVQLSAQRAGDGSRCFVVLSDGECDEGSNWEAALLSAHHGLAGLTVIVDRNGLQSLTTTEKTVALEPLADKWQSFGWEVIACDGNDHPQLRAALTAPSSGRPRAIIASTVKGKGVSFMENQVVWHYRPPSDEELQAALSELGD